jgi:hypothetical protein
MPEVSVENQNGTGFGDNDVLIRMTARWISKTLWRLSQQVLSSRDNPRCSVLASEVIQ